VTLPSRVREELRARLWPIADEIGWANLSPTVKAQYYENWTRDVDIGGVLTRYMDKGKIRVYIKDSLLKDYTRRTLADESRPLRVLGITDEQIAERFIKPHGVLLSDGRLVAWGKAEDWKLIFLAMYERAWGKDKCRLFGAVLLHATGRFDGHAIRAMIESAGGLLGLEHVVWLNT
jgi:hypothetical protein